MTGIRAASGAETGNRAMPRGSSRNIDLLGRWRGRARQALNSGVRPEISVSAALEESYREGLKRAATFLEENGFPELAQKVSALDPNRTTG